MLASTFVGHIYTRTMLMLLYKYMHLNSMFIMLHYSGTTTYIPPWGHVRPRTIPSNVPVSGTTLSTQSHRGGDCRRRGGKTADHVCGWRLAMISTYESYRPRNSAVVAGGIVSKWRRLASLRAAMCHGPQDVRIKEYPKPEIGPGDVLLDISVAGVCGSNSHECVAGTILVPTESPPAYRRNRTGSDGPQV